MAFHRRQDHFRPAHQKLGDALKAGDAGAALHAGARHHGGDVAPRAEGAAGPGDDDGPRLRIPHGLGKAVVQGLAHLRREGVAPGRRVEGQEPHAIDLLSENGGVR